VVSNGGENGASKNMESVYTNISSDEPKRTVFDQLGAVKLTGAAGETDYSSNFESVEADTSSGDQCVVIKCIVSGAPNPVAPMETGEMAVSTPRARTLSVLESVWTDTLSGELERTWFDQCMISNGDDDGASKKFESAEADTSTGELEGAIHDPCEIAGGVINCSEAVSLRTPVEADDVTGTAKESEIITTDVGLAWTRPDGRTMKMTDWSGAGLYLQLLWRTGVGWLDKIISLLVDRWKDELSRMPPLQRRGCK
jgi:hypothetical protein